LIHQGITDAEVMASSANCFCLDHAPAFLIDRRNGGVAGSEVL
jgi:hypothetical protein